MPRIVPVSDFRADIKSVSAYTDRGEIVILTQNGHPKWAMIDYDEWNAVAEEQERSLLGEIRRTEEKERLGELGEVSADAARAYLAKKRADRRTA